MHFFVERCIQRSLRNQCNLWCFVIGTGSVGSTIEPTGRSLEVNLMSRFRNWVLFENSKRCISAFCTCARRWRSPSSSFLEPISAIYIPCSPCLQVPLQPLCKDLSLPTGVLGVSLRGFLFAPCWKFIDNDGCSLLDLRLNTSFCVRYKRKAPVL